jgi:23S rRNA A1618 N6-methylase RlmF
MELKQKSRSHPLPLQLRAGSEWLRQKLLWFLSTITKGENIPKEQIKQVKANILRKTNVNQ